MNEGQGQNEVIMAEDDWMNWVAHGNCKKMKAGRQGKFIYTTHLIHNSSLKYFA